MNKTHGMTHTRPYKIWCGIKWRFNPNSKDYKRYGGRGLELDPRWEDSFNEFWNDMKDGYSSELTIDRIDNNKGYFKENCRWATYKEQSNNRRSNIVVKYKGEKLTLSQISDKYHIDKRLLYDRYSVQKWTIEKCVEKPKRAKLKRSC